MDTDKIEDAPPSLWLPETDRVKLALMGKLVEETGELLAKLGRCIIQGVDGLDPITGAPQNREELANEMADVAAVAALLGKRLSLDVTAMSVRADRKRVYLSRWTDMVFRAARR